MAVANPNFRDAGSDPGSAAHWTIRSLCQRARVAAFGAPGTAAEDFESWSAWSATLTAVVRAFFDAAVDGIEAFGRWTPGAFLIALGEAQLEARVFGPGGPEGFVDGWFGAPLAIWADVSAAAASFGAAAAESFEGWVATAAASFANATFGGASFESFEATWPALGAV
jgi:hypothetical protein